jgi:group II intron reverse transcriptase/maturase
MFLNFKVLNIVLNNFSNFFNLNILWYKKNIGNIISNNSSLNINTLLIWKTSKINKKEVCNSISGTPLPLHPYHLVDQSPWPLALSGVLLSLTISAVLSFHGYVMGDFLLTCSFVLLVWGMSLWFKDIISEASYLGAHTDKVVRRKIFISYEFYFKISPVSLFGADNQLRLQGKLEVDHSMLGKRITKNETDNSSSNSVIFSKIRPKLVKAQNLFVSISGLQLSCIKLCVTCINILYFNIYKMTINRSWVTILIKVLNKRSEENRTNKGTPGLHKACKGYGNRDLTVLALPVGGKIQGLKGPVIIRGRKSVCIIDQYRQYSSGATVKVLNKLADLNRRSKLKPDKIIDRDLYADFILNKEMFLIAYDKLKSNPGNMTPGFTPDTLDGFSLEIIENIINQLKSESFKFTAGRKAFIPKKNGGRRGLIVGNPRDKLVQEVLRMVLEAIYEPLFKDESHGFRVNRGCHSALENIFTKFIGVTWCIEGDFSNCFDNIDHNKLMDLISEKIKDRRLIRLLWKALKIGYFNFKIYKNNIIGTPQGSIISPILANIYLDQLDNFILTLKSKYDRGKKAKVNPIYKSLSYKIDKSKKIKEELKLEIEEAKKKLKRSRKKENKDKINSILEDNIKAYKKEDKLFRSLVNDRRNISYTDPNDPRFNKLTYVRYADDWLVGIRGTYKDAKKIKENIMEFCNSLKLILNEEKTKVTNIRKEKALFLGAEVKYTKHISYSRHDKGYKQRNSPRIILQVPIQNIINKLTQSGFIKNRKPHPKYLWLPYNHNQIINQYNSIFRGILNYYSFAFNRGRLVSVLNFYLKSSCAKLLATKYTLKTQAQVYKKFGKDLNSIRGISKEKKDDSKIIKFYKPNYKMDVWDFKYNANPGIITLYAKELKSIARLENLVCKSCGSGYKVEMHHVRALKDLNPKLKVIDKIMASIKRKQIPLCRICHMNWHYKNKR